ncbi:hypothetical protein VOLCADRAFT_89438 [Volvox carteri f. nagariensis]|uniref:Peptidase S8/S53 domain-containing protein n=1 Tax=Volvox carteri f. nagariensis TaxID=3068 RepID=D8TRP5_VOLCA|nr:uncharacterized protein VOLCADRAFT_89438 [Volvox carteri f. nagariensis]EFJ49933.1 hypothetical protein VOLCADRAFT_89438 [Volvox carteri f. nagariensis]|eukprot:XP_002948998.1 hypothetical protein VOLCADRAFT_89438 [Volvox carteri f. nagariensis]
MYNVDCLDAVGSVLDRHKYSNRIRITGTEYWLGDPEGHGTEMAGSIAGSIYNQHDKETGAAPDAKISVYDGNDWPHTGSQLFVDPAEYRYKAVLLARIPVTQSMQVRIRNKTHDSEYQLLIEMHTTQHASSRYTKVLKLSSYQKAWVPNPGMMQDMALKHMI